MDKNITSQTLSRLPLYFNYLRSLPEERKKGNISATAIAEALGLNDVQVRKDLASVSSGGRPKVGYMTSELMSDIGRFLGFENRDRVVVAGMGNFGRAMLEYNGFDHKKESVGSSINGKPVRHIDQLESFCRENDIRIGIITVPETAAQEVCDRMAEAGIRFILNFAAVHLNAPKGVAVHNENISLTLAMLARCGG